jgi:hypothetical protein
LAVQRRRDSRREEWNEQTSLAALLAELLDPACIFWTSLENRPLSQTSGVFQKRRGVRSGLPDVLVFRRKPGGVLIVFVEMKSKAGVASKVQKRVLAEMLQAGAEWWMARSAAAALTALLRSGVVFRGQWTPPRLQPWEGPFADPTQRPPQAPDVSANRRAATQRWRERQRQRAGDAAQRAAGAQTAA